jgi:hypothetical protein
MYVTQLLSYLQVMIENLADALYGIWIICYVLFCEGSSI